MGSKEIYTEQYLQSVFDFYIKPAPYESYLIFSRICEFTFLLSIEDKYESKAHTKSARLRR